MVKFNIEHSKSDAMAINRDGIPLSHGVLSSYSQDNIKYQKPLVTSASFDDDKYDSLPFNRQVTAESIYTAKPTLEIDPLLCVTPEKIPNSGNKFRQMDQIVKNANEKKNLKVTFDQNVAIKQLSPNQNAVTREVTSHRNDEECNIVDVHGVITDVCDRLSDIEVEQEQLNVELLPKVYNHEIYSNSANVRSKPKWPDRNVHDLLHNQCQIKCNSLPKLSNVLVSNDFCKASLLENNLSQSAEHVLARPEFNSTLKLTSKMNNLKSSQLDVKAAVDAKLKDSVNTRSRITEKASNKLNAAHSSFQGLISIDVEQDEVLETIERQQSNVVLKKSAAPLVTHVPDLLDFYSKTFQHELPSTTLYHMPKQTIKPQPVKVSQSYDLYHHYRAWRRLDL